MINREKKEIKEIAEESKEEVVQPAQVIEQQQSSDSEEYKTPDDTFDSFELEQSGQMSPVGSQAISIKENKKKKQIVMDGKLVCFKDFEILESIGEGSFGRVFKCKKKDNE